MLFISTTKASSADEKVVGVENGEKANFIHLFHLIRIHEKREKFWAFYPGLGIFKLYSIFIDLLTY